MIDLVSFSFSFVSFSVYSVDNRCVCTECDFAETTVAAGSLCCTLLTPHKNLAGTVQKLSFLPYLFHNKKAIRSNSLLFTLTQSLLSSFSHYWLWPVWRSSRSSVSSVITWIPYATQLFYSWLTICTCSPWDFSYSKYGTSNGPTVNKAFIHLQTQKVMQEVDHATSTNQRLSQKQLMSILPLNKWRRQMDRKGGKVRRWK